MDIMATQLDAQAYVPCITCKCPVEITDDVDCPMCHVCRALRTHHVVVARPPDLVAA